MHDIRDNRRIAVGYMRRLKTEDVGEYGLGVFSRFEGEHMDVVGQSVE